MRNNKIMKAVATVTAFSVATRTLAFVFKVYLSRTAGAEVVGLYQICLSLFFLFAALSSSGLTAVLSRKTAETRALNDNDKGHGLLTSTLIMGISVAIATVGLLFLCKPYLGAIVSDSRAIPLLLIMLPAMVSTTVYSAVRNWFWGSKRFKEFSFTEMLEEILRIMFTLLFVSGIVSGISGAYGIALAFTVSDFVVAIILVFMYLKKGGKLAKPVRMLEIAKPALPLTAMRVFGSLAVTAVALLLPARLVASGLSVSEATASFGRIAGMASPLLLAPNAIISSLAIVLIPELSENGIKKQFGELNKRVNAGVTFALVVAGAFLVLYASLGEQITVLLFKDAESGRYLMASAWLLMIMPVHLIITSSMNSIGMEKQSFITFVISTVFMLASVYFLTPVIGVYSVVIANLSLLFIATTGNILFLRKRTGLNLNFLKSFMLIGIFSLPCIFIAKNVYMLVEGFLGGFGRILGAGLAGVLYVVLVQIFGLMDFAGFLKGVKLPFKFLQKGGKRVPRVLGDKQMAQSR
ncbi:MAG: oligosaccharide flippase family protein [Firmicutes bacterium]|nr:oligosaccharide flippase family protein [Bacillota bacterium]